MGPLPKKKSSDDCFGPGDFNLAGDFTLDVFAGDDTRRRLLGDFDGVDSWSSSSERLLRSDEAGTNLVGNSLNCFFGVVSRLASCSSFLIGELMAVSLNASFSVLTSVDGAIGVTDEEVWGSCFSALTPKNDLMSPGEWKQGSKGHQSPHHACVCMSLKTHDVPACLMLTFLVQSSLWNCIDPTAIQIN